MADTRHVGLGNGLIEDKQAAGANVDVGIGVDEMHAVDGRGCALVELTGNVLYRQIGLPFQRQRLHDGVGHRLAKDAVFAFLHEVLTEAEEVVHAQVTQGADVQPEVLVQFASETLRLYSKSFSFLNKKPIVHIK